MDLTEGGNKMKKHLAILGISYFIFGTIYFLFGLFVNMAIYTGFIGSVTPGSFLLGSIAVVFPLLAIVAGYCCLYVRKRWSRLFSLCVSWLVLIWIPFGPIIGAYGIWILNDQKESGLDI